METFTAAFTALGIISVLLAVLYLIFRIFKSSIKYLMISATIAISTYFFNSYVQNHSTPKLSVQQKFEELTKGKQIYELSVDKIEKFSESEVSLRKGNSVFTVKGDCTQWEENLVGVGSEKVYTLFYAQEKE